MGIITISRQLGAGQTTVAPAVARALGWEVVDHQVLDRQVQVLGTRLPEVLHHDEYAPGLLQSWQHPGEADQYFKSLRQVLLEYAERGNVVVVGRGGNFVLAGYDALHVRLVADMSYRIQRVMEIRWVNEAPARDIIVQNDHDRSSFFRHFFKADWNDPLHYHMVLNTSQMGLEAVQQVILATARQRWPTPKES